MVIIIGGRQQDYADWHDPQHDYPGKGHLWFGSEIFRNKKEEKGKAVEHPEITEFGKKDLQRLVMNGAFKPNKEAPLSDKHHRKSQ
jgi:hypothetical protein